MAVRVPRQRLGQRVYYPQQDKRVFREAGCLPEGDTMARGWQGPEDPRPHVMCPVYANEHRRASVECV